MSTRFQLAFLQRLQGEIEILKKDRDDLLEQLTATRQRLAHEAIELSRLRKDNTDLHDQLSTTKDQLKSATNLNEELAREKNFVREQKEIVDSMKGEMANLIEEMAEKTELLTESKTKAERDIDEFKKHVRLLCEKLDEKDLTIAEQRRHTRELQTEVQRLKRQANNNKKFRMFVDIKKEINDLKERNEILECEADKMASLSLPMMTSSGKLTTPEIRARSAAFQRRKEALRKISR